MIFQQVIKVCKKHCLPIETKPSWFIVLTVVVLTVDWWENLSVNLVIRMCDYSEEDGMSGLAPTCQLSKVVAVVTSPYCCQKNVS